MKNLYGWVSLRIATQWDGDLKKKNILSNLVFEDGTGQPNQPCWAKKKFSARNGRTCLTPQALARTKINALRTRLNNYPTKNWLKNLKIGLPEPKLDSGGPKSKISPL
jgi:hypothetical protein